MRDDKWTLLFSSENYDNSYDIAGPFTAVSGLSDSINIGPTGAKFIAKKFDSLSSPILVNVYRGNPYI